jgi:hypothetical protein
MRAEGNLVYSFPKGGCMRSSSRGAARLLCIVVTVLFLAVVFLPPVLAQSADKAPKDPGSALRGEASEAWSIEKADPLDNIDCGEMLRMGIESEENFRAWRIKIKCGIEYEPKPFWLREPFRSAVAGVELPSSIGSTDYNLITGTTDPYPSVTQSESAVWGYGNTIFAAINTSPGASGAGGSYGGGVYSTDGGATFTRLNPDPFATGHSQNYGDPMVVYNQKLATWYVVFLATGCGGQGLGVWTSPDAVNWSAGVCAHNGSQDDRESMWVDNNPGSPYYGRMYISYADYNIASGALYVVYSDNGTTWTGVAVYSSSPFHRNVQITGSPGTDGTVFIASMDEGGGGASNRTNIVYRSTNGGVSWSTVYTGSPFAPPGSGLCAGSTYFYMVPPIWRHMGWGQPAVGPANTVHYVYAQHGTSSDQGDIYYIRSTDNGDTWSTPVKLNQDATAYAQWMPSLSATPGGQVLASWYDRRNSGGGTSYERWGRISLDGGVTWQADDVISDVLSPQPLQPDSSIQSCYNGDYDYASVNETKGLVTWADGRVQISGNNQQDIFFDQVQLCATVPAVPSGVNAAASAPNEITVTWNSAAGADCYDVYRGSGACPGSGLSLVSSCQAGTSYVDDTVSGGSTYSYQVMSVISSTNCKSTASGCVDETATGQCTLAPTFTGLASVTNPGGSTCILDLSWAPAASNCSGTISYSVYRSTTPGFTPGPSNNIALGVLGTAYSDSNGIVSGTTYYYVVRAHDTANGNEDANLTQYSGIPGLTSSTPISEDFEEPGGQPTSGGTWTHSAGQGTDDWAQNTAGNPHSPTHTFFTSDVSTIKDDYLVTPSVTLGDASAQLSFWHTYYLEATYDGAVIEISVNGGAWTDLGAQITQGGYTGTISTAYSSPIAGRQAWTGGSVGTETQVLVNLTPYVSQPIRIRFRQADDSSVSATGWYVDDVVITTASAAACTTTYSPNPKEASPSGFPMTAVKGSGTAVNVSYTPGCGGTDHVIYWGSGPISGTLNWASAACGRGTSGSTSFDPGDPPAGSFYYFVTVAQNAPKEGSYGLSGSGAQRPEADNFVWTCNKPQDLTGTCP